MVNSSLKFNIRKIELSTKQVKNNFPIPAFVLLLVSYKSWVNGIIDDR